MASRSSALARWQAAHVQRLLEAAHPGIAVEITLLATTGDRVADVPLASIGDRGLFTKEVDRAVLDGEVDIAVHSLKDMPTVPPAGIALGAVLSREDFRDAFVPAPGGPARLEELPARARVGTSSLRRRAQLLHHRPDLNVLDLRGNLDTRLDRIAGGGYDAAILAMAGLIRLGRQAEVGSALDAPEWLPAAGQGALAVVARREDTTTLAALEPLDEPATRAATTAERRFLRSLEGGCQIPIGALATTEDDRLRLNGFVASLDGTAFLRGSRSGPAADPEALGLALADEFRRQGADEILATVREVGPDLLPRVSAP